MKKIVLFSLIGIFIVNVVNAGEPVRYGLATGLNISKYSSSLFSSRVGFHLGGKAEIELSKLAHGVYCEAGAMLSLKGGKVDWGDLGSLSLNPYYLEIPMRIGYKYAFNSNVKVIGKLGPYFAFGLFGKEMDSYGVDGTEKYSMFTGSDAIKRFDAGLGLNVGIEIQNKFQFFIGNDWGLIPVYENSNGGQIDLGAGAKNTHLSISVTYLF